MDVAPSTLYNLKRSDELSFPFSEVPALSLNVQPSLISVSGSNSQNYDVRLCAEAGATATTAASALLEKIRLTRDGDTLTLASPSVSSPELRSYADVRVTAPRDAPISISGTYSAFAVRDMDSRVKLVTTHARIIMKPALAAHGLRWAGWHAYRRGLATNLKEMGVGDLVIQSILRHSDVRTTQRFYIKTVPQQVTDAMQQFASKVVQKCNVQ